MSENTQPETIVHQTVREYFAAIGVQPNQAVTADQIAGALEYFGLVQQPESHAPTPYAAPEPTDTAVSTAIVAAPAAGAAVTAASSASSGPSIVGRLENDAVSIAEALAPVIAQALAARL